MSRHGLASPTGVILLQYSNVSTRMGEESMADLDAVIAAGGLRVVGRQSIARVSRVLGTRERVFLFEIRRASDHAGKPCS